MASMPTPAPAYEEPAEEPVMTAPPVEAAPVAPAPAPIPAPVAAASAAVTPAPAPVAAAPQRPLVDENDWRVSRPSTAKAPVRAEPVTRPTVARPATDNRAPNLFQRITGAFSAPKPTAAPAAPAEPPVARPVPAPENVVAVAPKAPASRPAPVQTSISLDVTERAKPARDDDDLQIPAFLRRQAN
jgi:cell division protein FtsZ